MSAAWDAHVAGLAETTYVGGIFGLDGTQWTTTSALDAKAAGVIAGAFTEPSSLFSASVSYGGTKLMAVRSDGDVVILKKGDKKLVAKKAKTCMFIVFDESDKTPQDCVETADKMIDYIKKLGV